MAKTKTAPAAPASLTHDSVQDLLGKISDRRKTEDNRDALRALIGARKALAVLAGVLAVEEEAEADAKAAGAK